jgi:hypothetical protein
MKKCGKCKLEKNEEDFSPSHFKKSGGWCRSCNTEYMRIFKKNNEEKYKKYRKEYDEIYYKENKEKILKNKKNYYCKNKQNIKKYINKNKKNYNKEYYEKNSEIIKSKNRNYYYSNIESRRKYSNQYFKNKRKKSINFRIKTCISANIYYHLKSNKNKKSTLKYLPFTINQLKNHLEKQFQSWMNWNNYGRYSNWNDEDSSTWTWQIDHIKPHSTFNYKSLEDDEFKKCWSLENLRPLSSKQNFLDGANRIRH